MTVRGINMKPASRAEALMFAMTVLVVVLTASIVGSVIWTGNVSDRISGDISIAVQKSEERDEIDLCTTFINDAVVMESLSKFAAVDNVQLPPPFLVVTRQIMEACVDAGIDLDKHVDKSLIVTASSIIE